MAAERDPHLPPAHPGAEDHHHPHGWRVDPAPDGRGTPPLSPRRDPWRFWGTLALIVAVMAAFDLGMAALTTRPEPRVSVPYSPYFLNRVRAGDVASIASTGSTVQGEFTRKLRFPADDAKSSPTTHFRTEVPTFADSDQLAQLLENHGVEINAKPVDTGGSFVGSLLVSLLPTLLIIGGIVWLLRRSSGAGALGGFGRSRARRVEPTQQRVTFDDVAGIDEVKEELSQIVDFLRDPDRYRKLGGRIPHGVLLTGPPGTGKTLVARALAGEAQVPFFTISAAEFVEMFVGVGASRVRDLFEQAKQAAPAIIFIDELDAIGRSRAGAASMGGGNDEREQTLNQILTAMDGFDPSVGVIVLSATNRPEVLDKALLRPGRFDRRVAVQPPDTTGRRAILDVHTRSVPLAADVDLDRLAATTAGMVGADLANVVNEGALLAARRNHDEVTSADLLDALEKLVLGTERRILLSPAERRRTAYHEAGHALVGLLTPGADPVRKVSIVPRGAALGATLSAPGADRFSYDREYLEASIRVALGGRVAEELVFETMTTGAENDIRQLTELARNMVTRWGMSALIGPVATAPAEDALPLAGAPLSPALLERVDDEVGRIVAAAHDDVTRLLIDHRARLDRLVDALLEHETLDEDGARAAAGVPAPMPSAPGVPA